MSFFEAPPPPPEPPQHRQPAWLGPPENVLPTPFPLALTLFRTDRVAATAHGGLAFPNGFAFQVALRLRKPADGPGGDPFHRWHTAGVSGGEIPPDVLRLGVRFADGSKATVFDAHRWFGSTGQPPGPVLMHRGGGGGMRSWDFGFWVWPLPPAGPLALVVEWPVEGIELTEHELDTAAIRDAAARTETLWPDDDGPGGSAGSIVVQRMN